MKRLSFVLCSLMLASAAVAQGTSSTSVEAQPAPAADSSAPLRFEQGEQLSNGEKLSRSTNTIAKMRETLKAILGKLEEARQSKDVVRLNCVNEKLTQIKGFIRIGEQADVALQEAVAKQDNGAADHEYTKVEIAGQRVAQLRADAEACIGQLAYEGTGGQTKVDVTEPANLPSTSTSAPPPPPPTVTAPPPASPTTTQ